ncbi:3533_t:CDS:2 [Diversispora eburnea]|uniref:3533_t:CDS:1 n=1 Tax=Diversispora eburnea TaxID=1213867 RepID=A0A9N9CCM8_9GLOM|nr:3533_t:CDS:2 [Diversispora eburnea]
MATKISTELLILILNNVQSTRSTQDLYSSLLVNRIWSRTLLIQNGFDLSSPPLQATFDYPSFHS